METKKYLRTLCAPGEGLTQNSVFVKWSKEHFMKPHPTLHNSFERVWSDKLNECVNLFDALKFRLHDVELSHPSDKRVPELTFLLGTTSYKEFIGTNCAPYAEQLVNDGMSHFSNTQSYMADPLGVGALVETCDEDLIFMRRSNACAELQCMIDRPGGHPEPDAVTHNPLQNLQNVKPSKIRDEIFDSVVKEIRDEINIPIETLSPPVLLGISYNPNTWMRPSLEFYVRCQLSTKEVNEKYLEQTQVESDESTELVVVPLKKLLDLVTVQSSEFYKELTPAAQYAIVLLNVFHPKKGKF